MNLKVTVSPRDIEQGMPINCWGCPVARAIRRVTKSDHVTVTGSIARIEAKSFNLPEKARTFIRRFDLEGSNVVAPFTFTLRGYRA